MRYLHTMVRVRDLDESLAFYATYVLEVLDEAPGDQA